MNQRAIPHTLCLLLACVGCVPPAATYTAPDYAAAQANANAQVDATMTTRIEQARTAAATGGPTEAWTLAKEVENAYHTGMVSRGKVDGVALTDEAVMRLDAAAKTDPGQMLAAKGSLLIIAGRKDDGIAALEASFAKPNLWPVAKLLEVYAEGRPGEIPGVCKKARATVKDDEKRFALLDQCMHWGKNLEWASKADVAFYEQGRADEERKAAADNAAWRQKQAADREKMYASFSKPEDKRSDSNARGGTSTASSGPVSVTIRSRCGQTVRVFYGDKPKFGSGVSSTISSNSVQSHSFRAGDQMWVVDDHDNGVSSTQVSAGTREIEVGCTGLSAR